MPNAESSRPVVTIPVEARILGENDRLAAANRARFTTQGLFVVNLISSPGAGKTTLLVETLCALAGRLHCAVIEGDQQTDCDARRIAETGAPVVQINTGQACHLDAGLVTAAADQLDLAGVDLLFIENVGNLICPAEFDLGEDAKAVLMSVTEGEEKPVKYPLIFHLAACTLLTKCDLLPVLRFNLPACEENLRKVSPSAPVFHTSAYQPESLADWLAWLQAGVAAKRNQTASA
ncbi:MAG TPA: hydrogenase nickel incorporation protein HypB [Anaerolineaceae bacterium]|nr:hydrogenase nickel incorporation protein HypB [Anaerolineaceae bacterium]